MPGTSHRTSGRRRRPRPRTRFTRRARRLAVLIVTGFVLGAAVGVTAALSNGDNDVTSAAGRSSTVAQEPVLQPAATRRTPAAARSGSEGPTTGRRTNPATLPTLPTRSRPRRVLNVNGSDLNDAVEYAASQKMVSSVVVLDTKTGARLTAGDPLRTYAAASVTKVMIATRLLLDGTMTGTNAVLADRMIRRSDNKAAIKLYPLVGGDEVLPWLAQHYDIDDLGGRPAFPGTFGSTRITALGLARFYDAVRHDSRVWPWLGAAMHAYESRTPIGEPNDFGIATVDPQVALKNGWNLRRDPAHPHNTNVNSTGLVRRDRLVVVILSEGPDSLYFLPGQRIVSQEAAIALAGLSR